MDDIARAIAVKAATDAFIALGTLARVWQPGMSINARDSSLLIDFARACFGPTQGDDDTDPRDVVVLILEALAQATDKEHGCSTKEKHEHLDTIIKRLELVFGIAYSPTSDLAHVQAVELNRAGTTFAGVRPEDVNADMRNHVFYYWSRAQETMAGIHTAQQHDNGLGSYNMDNYHRADALVDEAIKAGAFIKPLSEMSEGQRLFWLQRSTGVCHEMPKPPRGAPPQMQSRHGSAY